MSDLFGSQNIEIYPNTTASNISFSISTINNPPYNGTFSLISIQIQDSSNRDMQICTVKQTPPTSLAQSKSVTMSGWNSTVGQTSAVSINYTTNFGPLSTNLICLAIYPKNMTF